MRKDGTNRWIPKKTGTTNRHGHQQVTLYNNGRIKSYMMGPLILTAFIGPCPEGMECCHNNGNAKDNRLVNLRWDTRLKNSRDKERHGTMYAGSKTWMAKLDEETVAIIRREWPTFSGTQTQFARKYGISKELMNMILLRKIWRHV